MPSVAERLDALGLLRDAAEPEVAAAVSAAVRDHEHGYIPPVRARVTFDDQYVTYWWNAVRLCGAAEMVDARYEAGKRSRAGRKANLSTRTVLTAMMVSALAGKPMLVSEFTTFLYERLSPPVAELLDVHRPTHDPTKTARARSVRRRDAEYGNVRRAVHRILSTIDPSIHPKGQVRRWLDLASTKRDLTVEEQQEMQAALDITLPYVRDRRQFDAAIGTFGIMQAKVADMYTALQSARAFGYQVARDYDSGYKSRVDAASCLLHASDAAVQVALEAIQSLGGNGYINEYPTGRILRDAKLYAIGAGTNEIRRMLIGRELFAGNS